jgi:hypothetical protein
VVDGLWLRSPRSPETGKIGGTVWLWAIPFVLLAFPTKRYQSTWIGLITHTLPSFVIIGVVLPLVL